MDQIAYEKNLENIYEEFGRVAMVPLMGAANFIGIDTRSLRSEKSFPLKKVGGRYFVSSVQLARWLS